MTDVVTSTCAECGADIYGTRFCENCGAPVAVVTAEVPVPQAEVPTPRPEASADAQPSVAASPSPIPIASTQPRGGTALRVITLLLLLAALLAPAFISLLPPTEGLPGAELATLATLQCFVGFFALLAAAAGNASGGAKAGGVLFALVYVALAMTQDFTLVFATSLIEYEIVNASVYLALFLSWAVGRPFRGPGYAGILFLAAFEFADPYVSIGIYEGAPLSATVLIALVNAAFVLVTVGLSALFERRRG